MRHRMCQIKEERFVLVLLDEIDRTCCIIGCKLRLVRVISGYRIAIVCRQIRKMEYLALLRMEWPHVVGIGQSVILIETVLQRQELLLTSQMPLSEYRCAVSFLFQEFAHRHLVRMNAIVRIRSRSSGKSDTVRIASGQQSCTRCSADRLSGKEMREANTFGSHLINIRCRISIRSIKGEIAITDIIQVDDNEIGIVRSKSKCRKGGSGCQKKQFLVKHNLQFIFLFLINHLIRQIYGYKSNGAILFQVTLKDR